MSRLLALVVAIGALAVVVAVVGTDRNGAATVTAASEVPTTRLAILDSPPPVLADSVRPLTNLDGWLQADFDELSDLEGQVVVLQFWTFGCINCKRTLANLAEIYSDYSDSGLEIVGVHAPEFEYEKDVDSILAAAGDLSVTWPIALDTDKENFGAWQGARRYWPRTYVIDQQGRLRYDHIGEGKYEELRATVEYLLNEGV